MSNKRQRDIRPARVGIFMPCYNLGEYIDDAIESLKKQTFTDFTLVISDDCSTDEYTLMKLDEIQSKGDIKISVQLEQQNVGMNQLCTKYMPKFDTEYVLMLSADDTLENSYLQETVDFLDANRSYTAVTTYVKCFGESNDTIKYSEEMATLPAMLLQNNFCGSSLIRQSDINKQPYFYDPSHEAVHEDYDLWVRLLEAGNKLGVVHKPLFNYRVRSTSASHSVSFDREIEWKKYLVTKHAETYRKFSSEVIVELWRQIIRGNQAYSDLYVALESVDKLRAAKTQELHNALEEADTLRSRLAKTEKYSIYPLARFIKRRIKQLL